MYKENLEKYQTLRIPKNKFKNGIYLISIQNMYRKFMTRKIVVMH